MKKIYLFLLLNTALLFGEKNAYIVTGPESTGSMFITEHTANVLGCKAFYGKSVGRSLTDDTVVVHISQPFGKANNFLTLNNFRDWLSGYKLHFILTTRDKNIVKRSKNRRFGHRKAFFSSDEETSKAILTEIMKTERFIIWNYETMIYLNEAYFNQLHTFLGVESAIYPQNLFDANGKHVK